MILKEHIPHHERMREYCMEPMLLLGNQENPAGFDFGVKYKTLDPDGGDYDLDLNEPIQWTHQFLTVYNLGTIEHVWDINMAFINACNALKVGGFFLHHAPCAGYENHGVHVTDWRMTKKFFVLNGFEICAEWFSCQDGSLALPPGRDCGKSIIFWMVAHKIKNYPTYAVPQQVFKNGEKL